jgi:predicted metal-dependent peptidase
MSTKAKFNEAVTALLMTQPFFGHLLLKMKHVECDTLRPATMAVSRTTIYYHPQLIAELEVDCIMFILAHEVAHKAFDQIERARHYQKCGTGPDGKPLDFHLFNCAMDYVVNSGLEAQGVGKFPGFGCLDQRFTHEMTPEEVYCILKKEQEDGKRSPVGEPMDGHDTSEGDEELDPITQADVIQSADNHRRLMGKYPAGIERLIGELKKPSMSPWRRLRQFVTTNLPGHDASTWRRLQRRPLVRGIGMPGRVQQGAGRVGVVVDTSGSIGQEMLNLFSGHMAAIMDDAMPREVYVYWVDAVVQRRDIVKNGSQLRALFSKPVPGGGGTDMPRGVRAAVEDKCDAVVVLTDGYTGFGQKETKPVLWAITSHQISAPHGITIHI